MNTTPPPRSTAKAPPEITWTPVGILRDASSDAVLVAECSGCAALVRAEAEQMAVHVLSHG
jgi:hypothetical protein